MEIAFGPMDSTESLEPFYDICSTDMYSESGSYDPSVSDEAIESYPRAEDFPSLVQIALQAMADQFDILYDKVPRIPEQWWELFTRMLPITIDLGYAALVVRDGSFWKKYATLKWPGYQQIELCGNSWKRYVLERYFSEHIENAEADSIDYLESKRLAEAFSPFIHKLEITQMNVPRWPDLLEMTDSTDSNVSGVSTMTLYTYMNRHAKFGVHPVSTERIYLGTIFRALHRLEDLKICFGYKNYYQYNITSFAKIMKLDALRLASSIEAVHRLRKLTITSSLIPSEMFELLRDSIECHEYLEELELSQMDLGDHCIVNIVHILVNNPNLRSLSLKENGITSLGVSVLAYALMHKKIRLKVLDLSYNLLDDISGCILSSLVLHIGYLNKLYLRGCGLGSESGINFGIAIKYNTALSVLDLSLNSFNYEAGESLLRGLEANETLFLLDVRGSNLPKETVKDILDICFEHSEVQRKKNPVYKYILPRRKRLPEISAYREIEGEFGEIESFMRYPEEKEEKKEPVPPSTNSSTTSEDFSDISDFYNHQKEALKLAGFTGTFSSGFGPYIEDYVEVTRKKQREKRHDFLPEYVPETVLSKTPPKVYYDKYGMPTSAPQSEQSSIGSEMVEVAGEYEETYERQGSVKTVSTKRESDTELENAKRYFQIGKRKKKTNSNVKEFPDISEEESGFSSSRRGTVDDEKQVYKLGEGFFQRPDRRALWNQKNLIDSDKFEVDSELHKSDSKFRMPRSSQTFERKLTTEGKKRIIRAHKWDSLMKHPLQEMEKSVRGESPEFRKSVELPHDVYKRFGSFPEDKEIVTEVEVPFWRPQSLKPTKAPVGRAQAEQNVSDGSDGDAHMRKTLSEKTWQDIFEEVMGSELEKEHRNGEMYTFKHYLKGVRTKPVEKDKYLASESIGFRKFLNSNQIEFDFVEEEALEKEDAKCPVVYGYTTEQSYDMYHSDTGTVPDEGEFTTSEVEDSTDGK